MALTDSLIAYYKFDESSGNASDASASGYTLTNHNTATYGTGKINNGVTLALSSHQYLSHSDNADFSFAGNFSVSFWLKLTQLPSSAGAEFTVLAKWLNTGNQRSYLLDIDTSNKIYVQITDVGGAGTNTLVYASTALDSGDVGTWHHWVFVYTAASPSVTIYKDGSSVGVTNTLLQSTSIFDSTADFIVGGKFTGTTENLDGSIDELGLWKRTLSSTEVTSLYNSGSGLQYPFGGTTYTKTLTEAVTSTPSLRKHTTRPLTQTITTTASLLRHTTRSLAQTLTMVSSFVGSVAKGLTFTEIVNTTATLLKHPSRTLAEINQSSVLDSYSESNKSASFSSYSGSSTAYLGQSFTTPNDGNSYLLSSAKFDLTKTSSPTGGIYAAVYAHTGTFGTTGKPTGAPLAVSDPIDVSTLPTSFGTNTTFTFSESARISLSPNTHYVVVVYYLGGGVSNHVNVGVDSTSPTAAGTLVFSGDGTTWVTDNPYDVCFYVYGILASGLILSDNATVAKTAAGSFAESVTTSAAVIRKAVRTLSEGVTLLDGFTHLKKLGTILAESLSATDVFARALLWIRTFEEGTTLTSTVSAHSGLGQVFTETVTSSATLVRTTARKLLETVATSSTLARAAARAFVESFSLTDTLRSGLKFGRIFTETLSTTDTLARAVAHVLTEKLALTDVIRQLRNGLAGLWQNATRTVDSWLNQPRSSDAWTDQTRDNDVWDNQQRDV
jgi:hypothetical protein